MAKKEYSDQASKVSREQQSKEFCRAMPQLKIVPMYFRCSGVRRLDTRRRVPRIAEHVDCTNHAGLKYPMKYPSDQCGVPCWGVHDCTVHRLSVPPVSTDEQTENSSGLWRVRLRYGANACVVAF